MKNSKAAVHALVTKFVDDLQDVFIADMIQAVADRSTRLASKSAPALAKGAKRDPIAIEALVKRLLAFITKHPGQRIEQIAVGMGITTRELNLPVKKLIASKVVKTTGHKRATTYTAK